MPSDFEVFSGGLSQGLAQGVDIGVSRRMEAQRLEFARETANRNAGFQDRRLRIDEEEAARVRRMFDEEIQAAQAESGAATRRARGQAVGGEFDRLGERLALAWNSGDPMGQRFASIGMHAMESLGSMAKAGAYVDRVERTAAAIANPEARARYLDNTLGQFEGIAAKREFAQLQRDLVSMQDSGALGAVGAPAEGGAGAMDQQGAGGPDLMGLLSLLGQGMAQAEAQLDAATKVSEYQAVRGAMREVRAQAGQAAQVVAARRAGVAKRQGLGQRFVEIGSALVEKGDPRGLQYLEMAAKVPALDEETLAKTLGQFSPFGGDDAAMMGPEQVQAAAAALTPRGGGPARANQEAPAATSAAGAAQPQGKPTVEQLMAEGKRRGVPSSKAETLQETASAREIVGQDTSAERAGIAAEEQRAAKAVQDEQAGPREAATLDDLGRARGFKGQPIAAGAASWAAAYEAALQAARKQPGGGASRDAARLLAWAEKNGDATTKRAAKIARERANVHPGGGPEESNWATKYREAFGRPWAELYAEEGQRSGGNVEAPATSRGGVPSPADAQVRGGMPGSKPGEKKPEPKRRRRGKGVDE